ncbi:putative MFS family arabinose efflux permease [Humitalea rosea]|uniref:Putative MFS family arabinose efflux permease n=2 Tax=Humitalea rosea TaxID=990373 RepID=A0A2W7IRY8_9PROT|nr:putative MFS family arabinose efflux permease [Humitalea rosea]
MVALLGVHLAGMGAFLTVPVLAPAIAAETGLSPSLTGFHTAMVYGGALISGPFTAALLRAWGGVRLLQVALCVIAAAILLALVGEAWALAASALLGGFGHGPVTPAGSHLLASRAPPHRRGLIFSLKQTGVPAGNMLIAALAPAVGVAFGWRWGVVVVAVMAVAIAASLQPLRAALDSDRDAQARIDGGALRDAAASLRLLREDPALLGLTLAAAGLGASQFCFASFFVVWQVESLGVPLAQAGVALALGQASGALGRVAWGILGDRLGARPVLIALALGTAASALLLALAGPSWPQAGIVLAGMAMGATAVGWNGLLLGELARLAPPGRAGGATAAMGVVFGAAMILSPSAFSALVIVTGSYAPGFLLCAGLALAGTGALFIGRVANPAGRGR